MVAASTVSLPANPSTQFKLTLMENKEVAPQRWISPRTVAFHLRNTFTKTGNTSRAELAQLDPS